VGSIHPEGLKDSSRWEGRSAPRPDRDDHLISLARFRGPTERPPGIARPSKSVAMFFTFPPRRFRLRCAPLNERAEHSMKQSSLIPVERIEKAIYLIRGEKVMLDRDLAALYGVATKALKQAVKRNLDRFPADFMFVLNEKEFKDWRSQFVTSSADRKGLRHPPMAFTEHGILMLSKVLNSKRAIQVNIEIMRAFVRLRQMLNSNAELSRRLDDLESKYDRQFKAVFDAIRQLMSPPPPDRKQIGFR
jgi:hypothetical protein